MEKKKNNIKETEAVQAVVLDTASGKTEKKKTAFGQKIVNAVFFIPRLINRKLKFKITSKTTAMYSLLYIIISIIIGVVVTENLIINIKEKAADKLVALSQSIETRAAAEGFGGIAAEMGLTGTDFTITDPDGKTLSTNTDREITGDSSRKYLLDGMDLTVLKKVVYQGKTYTVALRNDISQEMLGVRNIRISFAVMIPLGLIIIIALGSLASAAMLNPIKEMNQTIKNISAESLGTTRIAADTTQDELKELKDLLNDMLDNLEASFIEQTRFVSDASHELRTPIAVIQGYANLLNRWGKKDPKILDEAIEAISKESDNIKNMVDKLLFLAKADTLTLKKERFVLSEVLEEVVKETKMIARDNCVKEIFAERVVPVECTGDRDLIKQMVRIFVDNAVKYTDDSGIVKVGCYEEDGKAVIKIADNGIGIPAACLPNIFERFYRCDTARTRNKGSTGLGLSIAKWIADSHDGEITIESAENAGTTVYVKLTADIEE